MGKIKVIYIEKGEIEYHLIWSRRKTVGISIDLEHGVVVRAPKYLGERRVNDLVQEKARWIAEKWAAIELQKKQKPIRNYEEGELFLYMGRSHALRIERDKTFKKSGVVLQESEIKVYVPFNYEGENREIVKKSLELWYRSQALDYIDERIEYFSSYMVCPQGVIVKEQKRRWGSCSSDGVLRFNWRCIMATPEIIDYVVVHEMCHLEQMNHGEKFWGMVKLIIPDYLERKEWLKQHGHTLEL